MRPGAVFYKMSGSGNDFLVFDGRYNRPEDFTPERVSALCHRRHGVGADGAILLDPDAPGDAHFRFHFWNSDGSPGPMCGNGALCATRLSALIELAPADGLIRFATAAGLHTGRIRQGRPEIHLPDFPPPRPLPDARTEPSEGQAWLVVPSVPHLVVLSEDLTAIDLERRGPALRSDPAIGPGGANVNWIAPAGEGAFRMRTYERGVEGETLACGTGAIACATVLAQMERTKPPVRISTASGRRLDIGFSRTPTAITSITLSGEARLVFRGIVGEFPIPIES